MGIRNTIVRGNTADSPPVPLDITINNTSSDPATVNASYSIIGEVNLLAGSYNDSPTNLDVDPRLDTRYRLAGNSPAIDAAQCGFNAIIYVRVAPLDDIDGEERPGWGELTGCDIGADEYHDDGFCVPLRTPSGSTSLICL